MRKSKGFKAITTQLFKREKKDPKNFKNSEDKKPIEKINGFQGDVIFIGTNEIILNKLKALKTKVLAYGEVTGHKHQVTEGDVELFQIDKSDDMLLRVYSDSAKVGHEEHNTVTVPQGDYIVRIAREFDYESSEINEENIRMVID